MAKTTTTTTVITDDLDGSNNAEEVAFSFDGTDYTIDLNKKNRAALEKALKPYLEAGTKVRRSARTKSTSTSPKRDLAAIREWANAQGIQVSERGRVAASVIDQYDAANLSPRAAPSIR